jgi:hypothetical protein
MSSYRRFILLMPLLAAVTLPSTVRALECADFVSTSVNDAPDAGELIGTTEVIDSWGWGYDRHPGFTSRRYVVGHYRMSDGSIIALDCDNYRLSD